MKNSCVPSGWEGEATHHRGNKRTYIYLVFLHMILVLAYNFNTESGMEPSEMKP